MIFRLVCDSEQKKNLHDKNLNIKALSELTSGFSGADINNLINEAAIASVRNNISVIDCYTNSSRCCAIFCRKIDVEKDNIFLSV